MTGNNSLDKDLGREWGKRNRFLTQALIVSGALNIGFLATFFYFVMQEKETSIAFESPPASSQILVPHLSNGELLSTYSSLSFPELLSLLEDQEAIEEGYKKRDLALASLVAYHFFNLEKALGTAPLQKRTLSFLSRDGQEKVDLTVFPGLTDDQFQAIVQYTKTEKWPMTPEGLFFEVKQGQNRRDPSLLEAFYLTPEFHSVATLFMRAGLTLPKEAMVDMITQGDWKTLEQFMQEQKQSQDLTPPRLKSLLITYLKKRSLLAAKILLEWDREFVAKRLDDSELMLVLDVHSDRSVAFEQLLRDVACSPRTDAIWKKAAEKLYAFAGVPLPEPYDHQLTLRTFFPEQATRAVVKNNAAPASAAAADKKGKRTYIVQEGDNLWKIARKHKVSVEAIKKQNKLQTEKLKVGKELEIPEKA